MSAQNTITGRVTRVIRHGHTVYGNPIMSIVLDTGHRDERPLLGNAGQETGLTFPATEHALVTLRISDNASLVYGIENPEYREDEHTFALTRAGRVSHVIHD